MEFLLINHPLDCTICDQAGECRLQEYAVEHGAGRSRYVEPKVALAKAVDIGQHVMLDQERCIQCSRCTRFCDEVTKTGELAFFQRGNRTMIGLWPGRRLDNPYSGNTVDICPVGALTLKEFRFNARVWYLKNTPSVCVACARGCNVVVAVGRQTEMWTTRGQFDDRIQRIVPRVNEAVNGHWMCDEGRLAYRRMGIVPRLGSAQEPAGTETEWDAAVASAASVLGMAGGASRAAAIFSPRMTCESAFVWRKVLDGFGRVRYAQRKLVAGQDDEILLRADRGGNSTGVEWILGKTEDEAAVLRAIERGEIDLLLVFGDPLDPRDTARVPAGARSKLQHLVYVGPYFDPTAEAASIVLPTAAWAEEDGTVVNFEGRIQRVRRAHRPRGEGRPGWRVALDVAEASGQEVAPIATDVDVLHWLATSVEPFAGLDPDQIGLLGVRRQAGAAAGAR
jgi:NADH-quinone oxidoreductase subunit G